jgi:hypothetical protein
MKSRLDDGQSAVAAVPSEDVAALVAPTPECEASIVAAAAATPHLLPADAATVARGVIATAVVVAAVSVSTTKGGVACLAAPFFFLAVGPASALLPFLEYHLENLRGAPRYSHGWCAHRCHHCPP